MPSKGFRLSPFNLTGYVPYTGATGNVNLGAFSLTTTGAGTFGSTFQAILGDENNWWAGRFVDIAGNIVLLGDRNYAVNAIGNSSFNGWISVIGAVAGGINSQFGNANQYWKFEELNLGAGNVYPMLTANAADGAAHIGVIKTGLYLVGQPSISGIITQLFMLDLDTGTAGVLFWDGTSFTMTQPLGVSGNITAATGTISAEHLASTDDADIADVLTAGSLVTDVGGLTILGGQTIKPSVDSVSAISITNAAGTWKQVEFDTTNKRTYFRISDAGTDPAWNATDLMVIEAGENASVQFFTPNNAIGAFRFSRPSLTVPPYTSGRNKGGFGYNHATDQMFFAATLQVTFLTAGVTRSTIESDGDWQHAAINHYFANGTTYKITSTGDATFKDITLTTIATMGGTAPVADATYPIYNDGVTLGQVTSITTKSGIITAIAVIP